MSLLPIYVHFHKGYGYDWKIDEAKKNLLRTHTTAVSARMLHKVGCSVQEGKQFEPQKLFSIEIEKRSILFRKPSEKLRNRLIIMSLLIQEILCLCYKQFPT